MTDYDERYRRLAIESEGWGRDFVRALRTLYGQAVALLMHGIDSLRRTQVRLVVRLAPPDVADATALQARLFPEPPKDPAEAALRSSLCSLLATQANAARGGPGLQKQDWSTFAAVMQHLDETDKDWMFRLVAPTLNRAIPKPRATPAPVAETASAPAYQVQSFAGLPIANPFSAMLGYLSMGLAVLVVFFGVALWGMSNHADKLKAENKQARETQRELLADNVQLREALRDTDARVGEANRAAMENAKRAADVSKQEVARRARELANRKRLEEKNAERAKVSNPELSDPDAWLRELSARPLLSADPVAAADAPRGSVRDRSGELPGSPGGNAPPGQ